ncbi:MAG: hypothetical protein ACPKPY_09050 [Nitrososphaeraceae archaeon]
MVNRYGNTKTKLPTQCRSDFKLSTLVKPKKKRPYKRKCWVCNKGFIKTKEYEQKRENGIILKMQDTYCSNPLCKFLNTRVIG